MQQLRVRVQCPSGESRLFQVPGATSVQELKQLLEENEGIPCHQQVLCFAGQHLKDHCALSDYYMDEYTLSDEVVLYLSKRLSSPKTIFLTTWSKPSQVVPELVEADMPVGEVSALLESRAMASTCPSTTIIVKRQDGSTVPLTVNPAEGLAHLESRLAKQEHLAPVSLIFCQAQDGHLHCTMAPSQLSSNNTYPVYQRSILPQPVMPVKPSGGHFQKLTELSKELCVLP